VKLTPFKVTNRYTDRSTGSINKYLADISNVGMFESADAEYEVAVRAMEGDVGAQDELVNRNLRFVVSVAKSYLREGVSLGDLINEGNIGLIEAAKRFDPTKGNRFISYAVWWVRRNIMSFLGNTSTTIRIPINKRDAIARVNKRLALVEQELSRAVTYEDLIGETVEDSRDSLENLNDIAQLKVSSMDKPLDLGDGTGSMYDVIADDSFGGADSLLVENDTTEMVAKVLNSLNEIDRVVLVKRFGLDGEPALTLAECGKLPNVNISRERVRQIEARALRTIERKMPHIADYLYVNG